MNRRLLGLAVFAPVFVAACTNAGPGDPNKPKATAETPSNADTAAPPPTGTTAASPTSPAGSADHEGHEKKTKEDKEAGKDDAKAKTAEGGGEKADKVIHLARARMEFNHPGAGWTESKKGVWTLFHPADKSGVLAFVEFEKPGEAAARLGQIAEGLELSDIKWKGTAKKLKVGPEKLPAELSEGSCKMANKHEGEIEAYAVDGATLVVYAAEVDAKKADKHEKIATKTVDTLRRVGKEGAPENTPAHHKR